MIRKVWTLWKVWAGLLFFPPTWNSAGLRGVGKKELRQENVDSLHDLEIIHVIYLTAKNSIPKNLIAKKLSSCKFFVVHFWWKDKNYDNAFKFWRYRGLIGIDHSSLDKHLTFSKLYVFVLIYFIQRDITTKHITLVRYSFIRCSVRLTTAWLIIWLVRFSVFCQIDKTKYLSIVKKVEWKISRAMYLRSSP